MSHKFHLCFSDATQNISERYHGALPCATSSSCYAHDLLRNAMKQDSRREIGNVHGVELDSLAPEPSQVINTADEKSSRMAAHEIAGWKQ